MESKGAGGGETTPPTSRPSGVIACPAALFMFLLCALRVAAEDEESPFPVGTYRCQRSSRRLKLSVPLLPDGELYVVQRGQSILHGSILEHGRVEGSIEVRRFEQRVIGAWPAFLKQSPEITHDPEASRFSLTPIAPESPCESLRRGTGRAP